MISPALASSAATAHLYTPLAPTMDHSQRTSLSRRISDAPRRQKRVDFFDNTTLDASPRGSAVRPAGRGFQNNRKENPVPDTKQVAKLPEGVTIRETIPRAAKTECDIAISDGCVDHISTSADSELIHMFLTARRSEECAPEDFRGWITPTIERLRNVIGQLEAIQFESL